MINKKPLQRGKKIQIMRNSNYLPNSLLKAEFEEFRNLKTEKERKIFQQKRSSEFAKKTLEEQEEYIEASKNGIRAIGNRVEELICRQQCLHPIF